MAITANQLFFVWFDEFCEGVRKLYLPNSQRDVITPLLKFIYNFTNDNNEFMPRVHIFNSIRLFKLEYSAKLSNNYYVEILIIKTCCHFGMDCYCQHGYKKYSIGLVYKCHDVIFKRNLVSFDVERETRKIMQIYNIEKNIEIVTLKDELHKEADNEFTTSCYEIIILR